MKRAFSLVELSIVLVILGLLVGGVLSGQSLIRAAQLRSVSTEATRYITATQTFRDKYFAIPGDMANATNFWGATASCPGTAGTGTQTCNGDGDGIIESGTASEYVEHFTYWQHLANAGLIEGTYTGRAGAGSGIEAVVGNVPASKLSNAYWFAFNWNQTITGSTAAFDGTYRDTQLQFGALSAAGSPATPVLKPEEAWNVDTKIDDGRPAYGIMRERFWDNCTNAANSADLDANYSLTMTTAVCTPFIIMR
jgi:prepilin-type N-terminal cleavage/methylation domain-containing protein